MEGSIIMRGCVPEGGLSASGACGRRIVAAARVRVAGLREQDVAASAMGARR